MQKVISGAPARRFLASALAATLTFGPSLAAAQDERISFPHENASDFRGILNVFHAFQRACLDHPTERALAERLLPEGYQIVAANKHFGLADGVGVDSGPVLSKTGLEETDEEAGEIIIKLTVPNDVNPDGGCSVSLKRAWDYEENVAAQVRSMAAMFDPHVSYQLKAVLVTRPDWIFPDTQESFAGTHDWYTGCQDGFGCLFRTFYSFDPEDGINVSVRRLQIDK